ncbi:MAG TPA: YtxH domain-containing protein [Terriglobales bacterium]|jgi:hypothetical protein
MRSRNKALTNVLLGAGAYLLESLRERTADSVEEFRDRARETYGVASTRASRAAAALRGEDSNIWGSAAALLVGVGIGIGVGVLIAPASGEETRRNIADKVTDFGEKVRARAEEMDAATGTY